MAASTTHLGEHRARRFLRLLADESFVCLVVTDDELRLFSAGMDEEQLSRIKKMLEESEEGADNGEEG